MGAYLEKPVTDKESADDENDKLVVGSSSMQGWRENQEDAHNCILDFDKDVALFAVYDGHGGPEVAEYCSKFLPDYIKSTEAYQKGDYEKALVDAFLGFDATLTTRKVYKTLKQIADEKRKPIIETDNDSADDDDREEEVEENVANLYEEAAMPIEEVIQKYGAKITKMANTKLKKLRQDDAEKASNSTNVDASSSSTCPGKSNQVVECAGDGVSSTSNSISEANNTNHIQDESVTESTEGKNCPQNKPDIKIDSPDSSSTKVVTSSKSTTEDDVDMLSSSDQPTQNGQVTIPDENKSDVISSTVLENGEIRKGKGKALAKTKGVKMPTPADKRPKRKASQLFKNFLNLEESEESEDEEDKTFEGPNEDSSDDDYDNVHISVDDSESSGGDEEEVDDDDDDEEEEEECIDDDNDENGDAQVQYLSNLFDQPGYNSGCTAVVALLVGSQLYVANAGDSRCIISRNGEALEMSLDHNPELKIEKDRIEKAGGYVCPFQGRVNGGLNLSRAIGDHFYKKNKELSEREQLIIALPDIRTITIDPTKDDFMMLACDGIWNTMSSQKVVDFVLPRIKEGKRLSHICEELFDHCLAPNTYNEPESCDNMTAVIVQFKKTLKRSSSIDLEGEPTSAKREKTENDMDKADKS